MWILTGGAGFIGSAMLRGLNERGVDRVLVVEQGGELPQLANLEGCQLLDCVDSATFRRTLARRGLGTGIRGILHQGACTDTLEMDRERMMDANLRFSGELLRAALARRVPLVYASSAAVYGSSERFTEEPANEDPLNLYGESKLAFDLEVRRHLADAASTVVGLRYFNVYGPREGHKGRMASMVHQLHGQLEQTGEARLFEGSGGYGDGEQRRDFVSVDDVVGVALAFADGPVRRGIFNVGAGRARTFNAVARALIDLLGEGEIRYVPFPAGLKSRYQNHTCADLTAVRAAGIEPAASPLEQGVARAFGAATG